MMEEKVRGEGFREIEESIVEEEEREGIEEI